MVPRLYSTFVAMILKLLHKRAAKLGAERFFLTRLEVGGVGVVTSGTLVLVSSLSSPSLFAYAAFKMIYKLFYNCSQTIPPFG